MNDSVIDVVRRRLAGSKGQWPEIAQKTGLPYFTISNVANGKSPNPTIATLQPLLDYFEISVSGTRERLQ
jgi:transcriptional regulator with XRE-family HTH domain